MEGHGLVMGLIVHPLRLCCPCQPLFADIPIVEFDISEGLDAYQNTMKIKKRRELALSPFFVGYHHDIPVTPLPNPHTELSSYHIIRLVNGLDRRFRVDLLIQDSNLYFVAFRREIVLTEEEKQQGEDCGWGRWQRFKDSRVPDFLNARDMGIGFSYGKSDEIRTGGLIALEDIFYTFGMFDDDAVAGTDVKRASYRVMTMFCEPCRLRSMFTEICRRIRDASVPDTLHDTLWGKIRNWGQLSSVLLTYQVNNRLQAEVNLPGWCLAHGLATVDNLVGAGGELMLVMIDRLEIGLTKKELEQLLMSDGVGDGPEPGFQQL